MKSYDEIVTGKLFSYTVLNPDYTEELEGLQELIAYAAKVSNPSSFKQADMEHADKLINYLMDNAHWSPLEMADVTIEFKTTRDISHQIVRHRSFSFQEFSQRYAEALTNDDQAIEFVYSEARPQDEKNRQSSTELDLSNTSQAALQCWWDEQQEAVANLSKVVYQEAIAKGLAKEIARKVLPEGLTTTRGFMKGSLRSWLHYIELRSANGTQKEHMMLALLMSEAIQKVFPMMKGYTNVIS